MYTDTVKPHLIVLLTSGGGKGASAFKGQKYGILKFGRFWRIGVCIEGRIQQVR